MKKEYANILKVSSVYIAATIGAAFASGQEIVKFFTRFNISSYSGIVFAGLLFAIVGVACLDVVYKNRITNSKEMLRCICGKQLGRIYEILSIFFSFFAYCIMIAGASELYKKLTGFSYFSGLIIISILCTLLVSYGVKGVMFISSILTPIMIFGMLYLGIRIILISHTVSSNIISFSSVQNWFVYAILYVCYNSILNLLVMSGMLPWLNSRKTAILSGVFGGVFLFFALWVLNKALLLNINTIASSGLPMIDLSLEVGNWAMIIYSIILGFALLTTAISSGYCCVERLSETFKNSKNVVNICMGMLVVPLASQGFSKMIDKIYPLFGYAGTLLLILLIKKWLRKQGDGSLASFSLKS